MIAVYVFRHRKKQGKQKIIMLNGTHRDDVDKDVEFLKKVSKEYSDNNEEIF